MSDKNFNRSVPIQMNTLTEVSEETGLFEPSNERLMREIQKGRAILIIDDSVNQLYGTKIRRYFEAHRVYVEMLRITTSEREKVLDTVQSIWDFLEACMLMRRSEPIIAIGGGVLLDLASFAAATYRRGTPCIKVPTTLLAQIDAGIGIKTAFNTDLSKNRIGTYSPPKCVLIDRSFLTTLPDQEFANGMAEIIKVAMVQDRALLELLMQHAEDQFELRLQEGVVAREIFEASLTPMIDEIQGNPTETRLERWADFGHTFSPAIESDCGFSIGHGEAVAIDIVLSCAIAIGKGMISLGLGERVVQLVVNCRLPIHYSSLDTDFWEDAIFHASLNRNGQLRMPLPCDIHGHQFVNEISADELTSALRLVDIWASRAPHASIQRPRFYGA